MKMPERGAGRRLHRRAGGGAPAGAFCLEVQLSHAGDDRLAALRVDVHLRGFRVRGLGLVVRRSFQGGGRGWSDGGAAAAAGGGGR